MPNLIGLNLILHDLFRPVSEPHLAVRDLMRKESTDDGTVQGRCPSCVDNYLGSYHLYGTVPIKAQLSGFQLDA